ncbi:ABC transporter substrate-binding protein [Treponema primitia]|uniref:ABC transporter substrate-binding protein n=1 Tax=Treponema primitia TaxID=88058 RepID=UPI0002555099|nr:ABC transporter substrate-binding protein [Treponema primitia]
MRKIHTIFAAALTALVALNSYAGPGRETGNPKAAQLSTRSLTLAIGGEPDEGFDPCTGWGRYGSPLFQSTLLEFDRNMNFTNDLAAAYSLSPDGLVWTFDIRPDAKFTDGTPVTAADVAFTFNTAKETGSEIDLTRMRIARALSPTRVEFVLDSPMSAFINLTVFLGIVPEHAYSANYGQRPIGSGPYKFVQWDKGQQLIAERNEEYYGTKPAFERLTLLFLDTDGAFAAVQSGAVDIAMTVPMLVRDIPGYSLLRAQSVDNRGVSFPSTKPGTFSADKFPVGNAVTSDIVIRKALIYGIDRTAIVRDALNGYGSIAYSVCDGLPWSNPDTKIIDSDLAGQKAALDAAGWRIAGDGIRVKDGLRASFSLIYPAGDSVRQAVAMAFAQQARGLGIEVLPQGGSWDDIGQKMYSTPVVFGWGSHSPLETYNLYYGKHATTGYNNVTNILNPTVDRYMEAALSALSTEEANSNWKKAAWDGITGYANQGDATWCWIADIEHLYYVRDGLDTGNQRIHPHGHGFPVISNIKEWKLK